jgi:hypothetical protein
MPRQPAELKSRTCLLYLVGEIRRQWFESGWVVIDVEEARFLVLAKSA